MSLSTSTVYAKMSILLLFGVRPTSHMCKAVLTHKLQDFGGYREEPNSNAWCCCGLMKMYYCKCSVCAADATLPQQQPYELLYYFISRKTHLSPSQNVIWMCAMQKNYFMDFIPHLFWRGSSSSSGVRFSTLMSTIIFCICLY